MVNPISAVDPNSPIHHETLHTYASLLPILASLRKDFDSPIPSSVIDRFDSVSEHLAWLRDQVQARMSLVDGGSDEDLREGMRILEVLQMMEEVGVDGWVRWVERGQGMEAILKSGVPIGWTDEREEDVESTKAEEGRLDDSEHMNRYGDAQTEAGTDNVDSAEAADAAGLQQFEEALRHPQKAHVVRAPAKPRTAEAWKMVRNVISLLDTLQLKHHHLTATELKGIIRLGDRLPADVIAVMQGLQEHLQKDPRARILWDEEDDFCGGEALVVGRFESDVAFKRNLQVLAGYLQKVLDRVTFEELMADACDVAEHHSHEAQKGDVGSSRAELVQGCGEADDEMHPHIQDSLAVKDSDNFNSSKSKSTPQTLAIGEKANNPSREDEYMALFKKALSQHLIDGDPTYLAIHFMNLLEAVRSQRLNLTTEGQEWFDFLEDKLFTEVLDIFYDHRRKHNSNVMEKAARDLKFYQTAVRVLARAYAKDIAFKYQLVVVTEELQKLLNGLPRLDMPTRLQDMENQPTETGSSLPSKSVNAEYSSAQCGVPEDIFKNSASTPLNAASMVAEDGSVDSGQTYVSGLSRIDEANSEASRHGYSPLLSPNVVDNGDEHADQEDDGITREDFGFIGEQENREQQHVGRNAWSHESGPSIGPYVRVTLPAGFTIPDHTSHSPSITFPSTSHVFHFAVGATRDDLLAVLRHRRDMGFVEPVFEPPEAINIMPIRTLSMEWELKKAIESRLGDKGWDLHNSFSEVGGFWEGVGRGTTFLISGKDLHFNDVSSSNEGTVDNEELSDHELYADAESLARMRGGAGSPRTTATSDGGDEHWHDAHACDNEVLETIKDAQKRSDLCEYFENPSESLYESGNEIHLLSQSAVRDPLAGLWMQVAQTQQDRISDLEDQIAGLRKQNRELHARVNEAETRNLNAVRSGEYVSDQVPTNLDEIVVSKGVELAAKYSDLNLLKIMAVMILEILGSADTRAKPVADQSASSILADDSDDFPEDLTSLRGGGNDKYARGNSSRTERPSVPPLTATGFVFDAFTSSMFLVDQHQTFSWNRNIRLPQIRQILEYRRESEDNSELNAIRGILECRSRFGIPDPDTSTGRFYYLGMPPADLDDFDPREYTYAITSLRDFGSRNAGVGETSAGLYHEDDWYPRTRDAVHAWSTQSCSSTDDQELFHSVGDVLNDLYHGYDSEDESSPSYPGSDCSEPFDESMAGGVHMPYATALRGGGQSSSSYPKETSSTKLANNASKAAGSSITSPPKNGHDLIPKVTPPEFSTIPTHPNLRGGGNSRRNRKENKVDSREYDYLGNDSPALHPREPPSPLTSPVPVPTTTACGCVVIDSNVQTEGVDSEKTDSYSCEPENDNIPEQPTILKYEDDFSRERRRLARASRRIPSPRFVNPPTFSTNPRWTPRSGSDLNVRIASQFLNGFYFRPVASEPVFTTSDSPYWHPNSMDMTEDLHVNCLHHLRRGSSRARQEEEIEQNSANPRHSTFIDPFDDQSTGKQDRHHIIDLMRGFDFNPIPPLGLPTPEEQVERSQRLPDSRRSSRIYPDSIHSTESKLHKEPPQKHSASRSTLHLYDPPRPNPNPPLSIAITSTICQTTSSSTTIDRADLDTWIPPTISGPSSHPPPSKPKKAKSKTWSGPWIPKTVAGPSKPTVYKKKPVREEYDGMMWPVPGMEREEEAGGRVEEEEEVRRKWKERTEAKGKGKGKGLRGGLEGGMGGMGMIG